MVPESAFGVASGTVMDQLRFTDTSLNVEKATFTSNEIRSDRQVSDMRHGMKSNSGDVTVELGLTTYDALLEGALSGTFAAVTTGSVSLQVVAATKKFIRTAGSFVTDGFRVGMKVLPAGFTAPANNARTRVTAVTALELTVDSTTLVDEADAAGRTVAMVGKVLKAGTAMKHFTIERSFLDIGQYLVLTGCTIDSMNIDIQPEQMVTATFGFMGKDGKLNNATMATGTNAPAANSPFSAFEGSLYFNSTQSAVVTGISVELSNGRAAQGAIGNRSAIGISEGTCSVTGTLSAYFENATMLQAFLDEEQVAIEFTLADPNGSDFHTVRMPRCKFTAGTLDNPREGPITLELPYTAILDSVSSTSIWYQRSNT
jgi:hypothetical protein